MSEREYWLGFSNFPGVGPIKFGKLLKHFGSAKRAWQAPKSDLEKLIREETAEKFERFRKEFSIENYVTKLKNSPVGEVWFVTLQDKDYPKLLKAIKNAPFVLYGRGSVEVLNREQVIGIVGTRRITEYGREVTEILTGELVSAGFVIVSGLAVGVDAVAHKTALENPQAHGGKTIAVLGCGVDCCSPGENQSLYNRILESRNCIVSEYPLGTIPAKWTFPARNRIIAGLSQAVLVTEGAEDSGSLITADYALKFGRKVFAVPGPITSSMSKGPYKLISKGAKLVTSGEDIFKELKTQIANVKTKSKISKIKYAMPEELKILKLLENENLHFDQIVRKAGLSPSKLGSLLSLMEVKGMIKSLDGGIFGLAS